MTKTATPKKKAAPKPKTLFQKAQPVFAWIKEAALWLWLVKPVKSIVATRLLQAGYVGAIIIAILDALTGIGGG